MRPCLSHLTSSLLEAWPALLHFEYTAEAPIESFFLRI